MYVWPNGIPHRGRRGRRYGRLSPSSLTVAEPCVIDEKGKKNNAWAGGVRARWYRRYQWSHMYRSSLSLSLCQIAKFSSLLFPVHGRHVAVDPSRTFFFTVGALSADLLLALAGALLPAVGICAGLPRWPTRHVYNRRAHQALHLGRDPGVTRGHRGRRRCR